MLIKKLLYMYDNLKIIYFFSDREGKTGANRFDDESKRGKINKT